jgi:hypothetical protein
VNGAHSLKSIETAIRQLVDKRFAEILRGDEGGVAVGQKLNSNLRNHLGLSGEWPRSSWLSPNSRDHFMANYDELASGISFFLLEQLLWPEGVFADATPNLGLKKDGKIYQVGHCNTPPAEDFFYHFDPQLPPTPRQRKPDVLLFASYGHVDYPFLDQETWTVRSSFELPNSVDDGDASCMCAIWQRVENYTGGELIYREASGRTDRVWRAPSEIARRFRLKIDKIMKPQSR